MQRLYEGFRTDYLGANCMPVYGSKKGLWRHAPELRWLIVGRISATSLIFWRLYQFLLFLLLFGGVYVFAFGFLLSFFVFALFSFFIW